MIRLRVWANARPMGWFGHSAGDYFFEYDTEWLQQPGGFVLAPQFALAPARYTGALVRHFFENLLPEGEALENFARTGAVLAIHLSVHVLEDVVKTLTPHYGDDCPVAVVWRASWPDERVVRATLATLQTAVGAEMERTALILVGRSIGAEDFAESRLYAGDYDRRYRPVGTQPRFPGT